MSILDWFASNFLDPAFGGKSMQKQGSDARNIPGAIHKSIIDQATSGLGRAVGVNLNPAPAPPPPRVNFAPVWDNLKAIGADVQQKMQPSSTDQILQQLQALQDPSRYMTSPEALQAQARAAASAQYDPVIAGLRNQATQATSRGERNQRDVVSAFNQLSDSLHGDLPGIQQNYDQTQQRTGQEYTNLQNSIRDQYASSQADQEALYKRLNIQAAAPDVIPNQQRDQNYFIDRAKTDAQTQQSALTQERQGAVDYTNRGSQMARTEGTQRSSDIMVQLTDLLNQYNGQIGANEAAKAQAYTAGLGSLQMQSQKNALDRAQNDFTNYIASINVGRNLRTDQLDELTKMAALQKSGQTHVKSIADIPQRILGMGLPQSSAQSIQNVFSGALSNDLIQGGVGPAGTPATAEAKVTKVLEQGRQQGLSAPELKALEAAALEYFGRR